MYYYSIIKLDSLHQILQKKLVQLTWHFNGKKQGIEKLKSKASSQMEVFFGKQPSLICNHLYYVQQNQMDCRNCFCQKTDHQLVLQENEAKKIFLQSRQKMGKSMNSSNLSRIRDQKKSLKRSTYVQTSNLPEGRVSASFNPYEIKDKFIYYPRPISEAFQAKENKNQAQKYPQFKGSSNFYNEKVPRYISQNQIQPLPPSNPQIPIEQKQPSYQRRAESSATYYKLKQNQRVTEELGGLDVRSNGNINSQIPSSLNQPNYCRRISEEFKSDLNRVINQNSQVEACNGHERTIDKRKSSFLKPDDTSAEVFSSKLSRSPSGVRNIDEIACTKTESIGSSSSSEFSEIVFHQMPTQLNNVKKMTNSSINFAKDQEDISLLQMPESDVVKGKKEGKRKPINK